jgi:hypothetical protein
MPRKKSENKSLKTKQLTRWDSLPFKALLKEMTLTSETFSPSGSKSVESNEGSSLMMIYKARNSRAKVTLLLSKVLFLSLTILLTKSVIHISRITRLPVDQ